MDERIQRPATISRQMTASLTMARATRHVAFTGAASAADSFPSGHWPKATV